MNRANGAPIIAAADPSGRARFVLGRTELADASSR
jgi:hypothetical protein